MSCPPRLLNICFACWAFSMSSLFVLADQLSTLINPALGVLLLGEPLRDQQDAREPWPRFWLRAGASVGIAVALAEWGKHSQVWQGHPNFPSGHTTLATAAATALVLRRGPRWLCLSVPAVVLMGGSLVYGHWHTTDEVVGGLALGSAVAGVCFRFRNRPPE